MSKTATQKKLYRYTISGILFTSILGSLSHFFYTWSGNNPYIGLFAPVNESVWEHMKLLFFPMLLYFLFEKLMMENYPPSLPSRNVLALLFGVLLIPVLYYTYTGVLGFHLISLDIAVFYLSVVFGFLLRHALPAAKKISTPCRLWLTALAALIFLCFLIFTWRPPSLGLFQVYTSASSPSSIC